MANKALATRQKMMMRVAVARKPRNPVAVAAKLRAAGPHAKPGAERQAAKRALKKAIGALVSPVPRALPSPCAKHRYSVHSVLSRSTFHHKGFHELSRALCLPCCAPNCARPASPTRMLAERIAMSESSVKRMFGQKDMALSRLAQICKAAGIPMEDVLRRAADARHPCRYPDRWPRKNR
jgi:DNA-binding Xre family transcriptional regulator